MAAVVQIIFDNVTMAKAFMAWLDNSGEQHYIEEQDDCLSVRDFDYDYNHLRILTTPYDCEWYASAAMTAVLHQSVKLIPQGKHSKFESYHSHHNISPQAKDVDKRIWK